MTPRKKTELQRTCPGNQCWTEHLQCQKKAWIVAPGRGVGGAPGLVVRQLVVDAQLRRDVLLHHLGRERCVVACGQRAHRPACEVVAYLANSGKPTGGHRGRRGFGDSLFCHNSVVGIQQMNVKHHMNWGGNCSFVHACRDEATSWATCLTAGLWGARRGTGLSIEMGDWGKVKLHVLQGTHSGPEINSITTGEKAL